MEAIATPCTLPLGKIVVLLSLSLAPVITGRCVPTPLEQPPRNRHLGQLKDQVPHQAASHLDQLDLYAPQRPVLDRLGQTQPPKEVPKVVRQNG